MDFITFPRCGHTEYRFPESGHVSHIFLSIPPRFDLSVSRETCLRGVYSRTYINSYIDEATLTL